MTPNDFVRTGGFLVRLMPHRKSRQNPHGFRILAFNERIKSKCSNFLPNTRLVRTPAACTQRTAECLNEPESEIPTLSFSVCKQILFIFFDLFLLNSEPRSVQHTHTSAALVALVTFAGNVRW